MKKLILLALAAVIMAGCIENKQNYIQSSGGGQYEIEIIDSCEYITGLSGAFAHKGNCRFCAERRKIERKKEIEETIKQIKED